MIGIITHRQQINHRDYGAIYFNYIEAVYLAGGTPLLIAQINEDDYIEHMLDIIDGLLIPGGVDVHPKFYGEPIFRNCGTINEDLDHFEFNIIQRAHRRGLPILGICRGLQVLNVAFGGSLYQDIQYYPLLDETITHAQDRQRIPEYQPVHSVKLKVGSRLFDVFEDEEVMVNSYHHQFIKDCAPIFEVVATSPDDIIEGIESKEDNFVVGVQWHPEKMFKQNPEQLELFKSFIGYAKKFKRNE